MTGKTTSADMVAVTCAGMVANAKLEGWSKQRIRKKTKSLYKAIDSWIDANGISRLDAAAYWDPINVVLARDRENSSASDLPELIALIILQESSERPHLSLKGASILAAFQTGIIDEVRNRFGPQWLKFINSPSKAGKASAAKKAKQRASDLECMAWALIVLERDDLDNLASPPFTSSITDIARMALLKPHRVKGLTRKRIIKRALEILATRGQNKASADAQSELIRHRKLHSPYRASPEGAQLSASRAPKKRL